MRILKPGGRALIYVWAFEQEYNKQRSKYLKDQKEENPDNPSLTDEASEKGQEPNGESQRHLEEEHKTVGNFQDVSKVNDGKLSVHTNRTAFNTQDLLVPWHLKEGRRKEEEDSGGSMKKEKRKEKSKKTSGNSSSTCSLSSSERSGCNPDRSSGLDSNMSPGSIQDTSAATQGPDSKSSGDKSPTPMSAQQSASEISSPPVFHRFYHVFQQGELEVLCSQVTGVRVQSSYHDQGNWCVILEKTD